MIEIDWCNIQNVYDTGLSTREISKLFKKENG